MAIGSDHDIKTSFTNHLTKGLIKRLQIWIRKSAPGRRSCLKRKSHLHLPSKLSGSHEKWPLYFFIFLSSLSVEIPLSTLGHSFIGRSEQASKMPKISKSNREVLDATRKARLARPISPIRRVLNPNPNFRTTQTSIGIFFKKTSDDGTSVITGTSSSKPFLMPNLTEYHRRS